MKKTILAAGLLALTTSSFSEEVKTAYHYKTLKMNYGVSLVDENEYGVESVSVSSYGDKVCWIGKSTSSSLRYPIDIFVKKTNALPGQAPRKIKKSGRLNAFSKCSFDNNGNVMASELLYRPFAISATLLSSLRTGDFEPKKYHSAVITYDYENNDKLSIYMPTQMGQASEKEFIKHPRVSPDNNWLAYYTMGNFSKKGVYLHNLKTKKTFYLGNHMDKHPTWSSDGTKLFFHFQKADRKKGEVEQSYLGYYKVYFRNNKVYYTRVMIDDPNAKGYVYHKHPVYYPNTNLLFFHGQTKPEGRKKLFVRDLDKKSSVYEIKMKIAGDNLKKVKHPSSGVVDTGLYFVGKTQKEGDKYKIYRLSPYSIHRINNLVK